MSCGIAVAVCGSARSDEAATTTQHARTNTEGRLTATASAATVCAQSALSYLLMSNPLLRSVVLAVALVVGIGGPAAAEKPRILVCDLPDNTQIHIVIENFDGMRGARRQCLVFWNGRPSGLER